MARYGVLSVTLLAPLLIGGAPPVVQVVLSFGALLAACAWALSRGGELRRSPFMMVGVVAVAAILVQLVPLPHELVAALSPRALEIRGEALGARPAWLPLSLDVPATSLAAVRGFSLLAILLVTTRAIRWRGRTLQLTLPLGLLGGLIGLLSFAQRGFGATTILGLYQVKDMPGSGFFGTFVNGNHASSFFALSAIVAIGCAREAQGHLRLALGLSALVSTTAVVSTGSRMGMLGLATGLLALAACWLVARFGTKRGLLASAAVAATIGPLAVIAALAQRGGVAALSGLPTEQKLRGWRAGLQLATAFPWTGVGRGAFEGPATAFRVDSEGVRLVYPENLVVQVLSEWGFPLTLALLVLFLGPAVKVVRRIARWEPVYQAAACAVLAVLVHELADFALELPGVAFPAAMLLGLCAGRLQMSADESPSEGRRRFGWPVLAGALGLWGATLLLGVWAVPRTTDADGLAAAKLARVPGPRAAAELKAMVLRHPAEYYFELQATRQAMRSGSPAALRHLNRALRLFPGAYAPHILAFHYLASVGRKSQAAMEYRLAVEHGYTFSYAEVAAIVGPSNVMRAVPQQPEDLFNLAEAFVAAGRDGDADKTSARAVDLAAGSDTARVRRLQIALKSRDPQFQQRAGIELARIAETTSAFELAAEGLARSGDTKQAGAVVQEGLAIHPNDNGFRLRCGQILFRNGDLLGAQRVMAALTPKDLSLVERIASEELLAQIADKQGNPDAAAAARARARLLGRLQGAQDAP